MPSSTRSADGRLWFLTSVGLVTVDPGRLRARPAPGPLRIESVVADGRVIEPLSQLRLAPHTSRMQINYSILSLSAATKLRFRYKLEDFDSDWQEAGEQRQAFYTNLTPGSYRFHVVSNTNDGGWNATGAELDFSIEPAFYQTKVFFAAVLTMMALTIWSIWQLRLRRIRRQFDLVLAERARMGREIHDTLLQSLVGVALEFDDISGQLDPSATSLKAQVCRIREQVEHYIREARHSIWNLRSPTLEAIDLSAALLEAGEAATAGGHARFEFVVNGTARWISASVEEQLLRIGQEALSNAVRHGAADVIRIELSYRADSVSLRVSDNGRGFDSEHVAQALESHWGLTSMRERAQQVGARFILLSRPGAGTTIEAIASISSNK
jgi:signal transduction histidine kinase